MPPAREKVRDEILPGMLDWHARLVGGDQRDLRRVPRLVRVPARARPGDRRARIPAPYGGLGHGYATEGARALVDEGFRELGVHHVVASTMAVNTGSRRVLEKCGIHYVRTVHLDWPDPLPGSEHGDVEYTLDRVERAASR